MTRRSPATAEVGDVQLAGGGGPNEALRRQIGDTLEGRQQTCTEND